MTMGTALVLLGGGALLVILILLTIGMLLGRRVRRGRKRGLYPYRSGPGTYDNSSMGGGPH
ncbi:hypothetical protein SAMN05421504_1046 [Amycolatopsis xylanica]|uniref:Uncharacterized protein n=1 Tax=Amycolatopsis xylanica TaxID=589385 RepID=A0A1H3FWZ9_9PSEU|nr:hypothetical protein [Amycolatopsis xylanica]SDX94694.1 hypothetical protein SAMN05421504_1046 [Amycolatopsis xylanica]